MGDMRGCCCVTETERDKEGVGGDDGASEFARERESRRDSAGTSTHPKRAVSMAVSESSSGPIEPGTTLSVLSRPESLVSASGGGANAEMVARNELS